MKASIRRLGLLLTLALALPGHLLGDSVSVTITVDNGYGFGFGDTNGIFAGQYYGGVDNCTAGQIFGSPCYVFVPPDGTVTDTGPEIYTVTANSSSYIYIVAWSDDGIYQGAVASFTDNNTGASVTTSPSTLWPWEVFATGTNWQPNCSNPPGQHGPPLTGFAYGINDQIGIANASAGGPGTSVGWVGNNGWLGSAGVAPAGSLINGRLDFSGQFNGNTYPVAVPGCLATGALWMEYNPEPTNASCNPFVWGSTPDYSHIANFLREYLIYRIGPLGQIPGFSTNACTNSCITIYNPDDIMVYTCSNSMPVNYSVAVVDTCCSNYTVVSDPPSGFNFPLGTNYVTTTVTDDCGNSNNCSFTVTVLPGTNCSGCLEVECAGDKTVPCDTSWKFDPPIVTTCCTNMIGGTTTPTNLLIISEGRVTNGVCPQVTITKTWLIVDGCGDSNTCSQTVTVTGCCTNCLEVECPTNKTVPCGSDWSFDAPVATTCCTNLIGTSAGTATNLLIIPIDLVTNGACPQVAITQTWLILDGCGESNTCSQTVTVLGCCTNCLQVECPTNKTVASCSAWTFDPPVVMTCCTNLIATDFGTLTNLLILPTSLVTNGVCPQVDITQTWLILDGCGESNTCSQTVTVIGCCTNCCGTNQGPQNIQWLQGPAPNSPPLVADPLGLNTNATWIITNLPCYGRVLITQTFPDDPTDQIYWFLNLNLEGVPGAYGSFQDVEAGYGPYYSWGTFGSLLNFYNGFSSPNITYNVNFYFLDGAPNPCTLYLGVVGLASQTTATVSQPVTFRAEYDLQANAPGGNGYASANTTLNGLYGGAVAGAIGTVVGSAYSANRVGDPSNTGWAVLQPNSPIAPATLPPGNGHDINADSYPPTGSYPCLSLAVNQEGYDGIGFTVGYVCCPTNCLQVECPTNKTVQCGSAWSFDPPIATTCCTQPAGQGSNGPTNLLIIPSSPVTNGVCPEVTITQTWLIIDGCGDSDACSQVVTVEGCCTNCIEIACPTNIFLITCSNCAVAHFTATVVDTCCSNGLTLTYNPPSGSCFPAGTNLVQVLATDSCGGSATCEFRVTVSQNDCPPIISLCPTNFILCAGTNGCATMPDEVQASYPVLFGLYNTGVGAGFTAEPLPIGSLNDPHWNLVTVPTPPPTSPLEFGTNMELQVNPATQWVAADEVSAWISPANDGASDGPEGNYDYQTSFVLPAETAVTIAGQLAAAATVVDVRLNGVSTGLSFTNGLTTIQWNPFTLAGAGLAGTNLLDIIVQNNPLLGSNPPADNQDTPTGLLVEFNSLTLGQPYLNYIPAVVQATNCDGSPASGWQSIPPGTRVCNDTNIIFTFTNNCGDATSCTSLVTVETCCFAPPSGMVLWLTLDETVGDTCLNSAGYNNGERYEGVNPATPANGPTHTLGQYVDNSLCFDGTGDKVVVPNYAAIDFGTQNFTLDAWVKWNGGTGNEIMLDHRIQSGGNYYGYSWYLANGHPGIQLATGPFHNFMLANALAPNVWTHLAVTVQRGSASGLNFYVNGVLAGTFNLTGVAGTLFNTANLWIGASPLANSVPLNGCLDEIEIFNRVLSAGQIAGIYDAGRTGKCRPTCSVPAASAICFDATNLVVPVQICNSGSSPLTVTVNFIGLTAAQAGGYPAVNGPTLFTGYPGTVTLPPDTCTNFTVTIGRPPGLTPATVAYYQMIIHDPSGQQFSAIGKLTELISIWCNVVTQNTNQVHWTQATNIVFQVNNPDSSPINLNSEVLVLDGNLLAETNVVSLNGMPPGTPLTNQWVVAAAGSQLVSVNVNYLDAQPWTPYYLVLFLNIGVDGALIPVASTAFAQVPPANTGPLLTTSTTNGQVIVSWDMVNTGWSLWSKSDLTSTNWTPVNLPALQQADGSQGVSLPLTNQAQFFQLLGPGTP
jgi:hypothetical protein